MRRSRKRKTSWKILRFICVQDILANRFGLNFEAVLLPSEKFNENWMCFKTLR